MALFPTEPTNGQLVTVGVNAFQWDGTKWNKVIDADTGGDASTVTASDTAPADPVAGDMWFNTNNLELYVYYNDGTDSQWVQVTTDDFNVEITDIDQNLLPTADSTYNLGSGSKAWLAGYFDQLYLNGQSLANISQNGSNTATAIGIIATSDDLPTENIAIGQIYAITDESAVKIWLGRGWINLVDSVLPSLTSVTSASGEAFDGTTDFTFIATGTDFQVNGATVPTVIATLSDDSEITANYVSYISPTELRFSFFRTFSVADGPLDITVINPGGLSARLNNAILQTGSAPQWIGPTQILSAYSEAEIGKSIRTSLFLSDDNPIDNVTFKVYTDNTHTTEKTDRIIISGTNLTLDENGFLTGTAPIVTSQTSYSFTIGFTDQNGNESFVDLSATIISSPAVPTAETSFAASSLDNVDETVGLTNWTVIQAPYQNSTMLNNMQQISALGGTSVPLQRYDDGWFTNGSVCKIIASDTTGEPVRFAFEAPDQQKDDWNYNTDQVIGGNWPTGIASSIKRTTMWGFNQAEGWVPLWHFVPYSSYDISSNRTIIDAGEYGHNGWNESGNYGSNTTVTTTSTSQPTNGSYTRTGLGKLGRGGTTSGSEILSPVDIPNIDYVTHAQVNFESAAGDFSASNEYVYVYYGANTAGKTISTGVDSANLIDLGYSTIPFITFLQTVNGRKSLTLYFEAPATVDTQPTQIVTANAESLTNTFPANSTWTYRINFNVVFYTEEPGSTTTNTITGYSNSDGIGKQPAYDTFPLEYIGFATYA